MVRDEHPQVPVFQVTDNVLDIRYRQGVDAGKGLVQDDKMGGGDQGPGDLHPAPLTPGEGRSLLVGQVGDAQVGQQLLQAVLAHLRVRLQSFQDRQDILGHRKFPEHRRLLGEVL